MRLQSEEETESLEELLKKANSSALTKPQSTDTAALTDAQLADKDFLRKMCLNELAAIVWKNKGDIRGLPATNALLDRIDGKPAQAITMAGNLNVVTVNANVSFVPASRDNVIIDNVDNVKAIDNKG